MLFQILFVLLSLDVFAVLDNDLARNAGAIVALVLAIIGAVLIMLERRA